jgi:hypothetical protein
MFTINFWMSLGVEKLGVFEGTYWFSKQVKFPYVPHIGETVKFGSDSIPPDELAEHEVESVCLNTHTRDFDITLASFVHDAADADSEMAIIESYGFGMVRFDSEEPEELVMDVV